MRTVDTHETTYAFITARSFIAVFSDIIRREADAGDEAAQTNEQARAYKADVVRAVGAWRARE